MYRSDELCFGSEKCLLNYILMVDLQLLSIIHIYIQLRMKARENKWMWTNGEKNRSTLELVTKLNKSRWNSNVTYLLQVSTLNDLVKSISANSVTKSSSLSCSTMKQRLWGAKNSWSLKMTNKLVKNWLKSILPNSWLQLLKGV